MWTAVVNTISDTDASGSFIVTFTITSDSGQTYPNLQTTASTKDEAERNMKAVMASIKSASDEAATIAEGMEVTLQ